MIDRLLALTAEPVTTVYIYYIYYLRSIKHYIAACEKLSAARASAELGYSLF